MTWWEAALLGLVQGLTEFLPVSSSAHLVLGKHLLGLDTGHASDLTFEVFVHFGTVLSILTVYGPRVGRIIADTWEAVIQPSTMAERFRAQTGFRTAIFVLITMVPTGIVYIFFKDFFEQAFSNPRLAAGMLNVTGLLLVLTLLRPHPNGPLTGVKAFFIGVAQSAAMIPGISRSGSTICTALYQNVMPEQAANFSFLMLLPVVIGATLIKGIELVQQGMEAHWLPLLIGTAVAYASGVLAIKLVLDFVRRGKLGYFAIYCFIAGTLGLLLI